MAQEELGEATAIANEQLQGLPTIQAYQSEREELERFRRADARFVERSLTAEWWSTSLVTAVWMATALGLLAAIWYGSRQVIAGTRSPGDLLVFALFAVQAIEPLRRLSDLQGRWQRALAAADRIFALIDLPGERQRSGRRSLPERSFGPLEFDSVVFAYRPGEGTEAHTTVKCQHPFITKGKANPILKCNLRKQTGQRNCGRESLS